MPANIETSFLAKQPAWWGFQTLTDSTLTTEAAFQQSGLDWNVEKRPAFTVNGAGVFIPMPDRYAVVRDRDDAVLGDVGAEYEPIQNIANFDFLDEVVGGGARWESAGSLRGGRRVWALLHAADSDIDMGGGDIVKPYILATNSHDGTSRMIVKWVTRRVVCENTLNAALHERGFNVGVRHSGDIPDKIATAQRIFAESSKVFAAFEARMKSLQAAKLTRDQYEAIVAEMFPPVEKDGRAKTMRDNNVLLLTEAVRAEVKLLPQFTQTGGGINAWMMLNGFTRFADHAQRVQVRNRDAGEVRFEHALLGGGDEFKAKAANVILDAVGVK